MENAEILLELKVDKSCSYRYNTIAYLGFLLERRILIIVLIIHLGHQQNYENNSVPGPTF